MRALIQRVWEANVVVDGEKVASIGSGLCVFVGVGQDDSDEDIDWLTKKVVNMRILSDKDGMMNESTLDQNAEVLLVSQFTLHASTKKGNRPSFIKAAKPDTAQKLFDQLVSSISYELAPGKVQTGVFGADMKVSIGNDGPVSIWIDTKDRQ